MKFAEHEVISFENYTHHDIRIIQNKINRRPRKKRIFSIGRGGFKTFLLILHLFLEFAVKK